MKKTFQFLLCLGLLLFLPGCLRTTDWMYFETAVTTLDGESSYSIAGNKKNLEKGEITDLSIPDKYSDATPVSVINPYGFAGCTHLEQITLPEELIMIGTYSFSDCTALRNIIIPGGVTVIPEGAFQNCVSLRSVTFSENLYQISSKAFENCASLEHLTIPRTTTIISNDAFEGCENLSRITFENRKDFEMLYWSYEDALDGKWETELKDTDIVLLRCSDMDLETP